MFEATLFCHFTVLSYLCRKQPAIDMDSHIHPACSLFLRVKGKVPLLIKEQSYNDDYYEKDIKHSFIILLLLHAPSTTYKLGFMYHS